MKQGEVNVADYGEVIKSGWGDYPSKDKLKEVENALIQKAKLDTDPRPDATALHLSVFLGKTDFVQLLVDHGADVNAKDCFGMTSLHLAAMRGNLNLMKILLEKDADVNATDEKGGTPIDVAVLNEQTYAVKYLKNFVTAKMAQVCSNYASSNISDYQCVHSCDLQKVKEKLEQRLSTVRISEGVRNADINTARE